MNFYRWVAALVLVALYSVVSHAQTDQGRFSGIVRDAQNAFVPDATVTIKNEKTGESRTTTSNIQGLVVVAGLKPSTYTIRVEKTGFAPVEYTNMPIAVGQELTLDFQLQAAGVQESINVVGTSPVIDISSAKIGANVSEREVQGLPVNGRQMSQLMLQAPGSQNAGTGTWGDIRFSGRAVDQNVIKYDGVEGSGIIDAAPGVLNGENPSLFKLQASLENVQEFRVESSNYPAEHGTGTGGQVSVITKSGGNQFRGSVFEYLRRDSLDAANYFDSQRNADGSIIAEAGSAPTVPKSPLDLNQFGGSIGGPILKDRAFFFASYEGYRLDAGRNLIQGVPSEAAWAKAVPAVAGLRSGFAAPDAVLLPGASTDPNVDIMQWQANQRVREHAYSARLDYKINNNWSSYYRVFHDQAESHDPQDVSGRFFKATINPTNMVFNLQGILGSGVINEFKFGYNGAPSTEGADTQPGFEALSISLTGNVANAGIAGQGANSSLASPGGLVRVNSAGNGRAAPYNPYSLTFADSLSKVSGTHLFKTGVDVRVIRMSTDQLGGTTYTYSNVTAFINNQPTSVLYFGDLSEPSPFHNGASGLKHIEQEYYVGYAQDEWRLRPNFTLNYGLRYDYYVPLTEADNRIVKFNVVTGQIDPDTTPFYQSKKNSFQPRIAATYSPTGKTVFKSGFGIFVGPGQTEDQIQPIEAERISTSVSSGPLLAYPVDPAVIRLNFTTNPNNRAYQPRAYSDDYTLPEKVYQYTASVQQEVGGAMAVSAAYVGSQGRNLFLRSITNQIVGVQTLGATAGRVVREFSLVTCADGTTGTGIMCPGSTITGVQNPYGEVDYKTSGGTDSYNALQLALTRRAANGVVLNGQYTLAYSKGTSGGTNEARTAGNAASLGSERPANRTNLTDWDNYEYGYNLFDVRHTFNLSLLYSTRAAGALKGGWIFGGIMNARSGLPLEVQIARNDIVYMDAAGNVFNNPTADRTALVNTPGGGATRNVRRPDLVPGVDPFIKDGGLLFLNPAAFATPLPGTNGNLERNSLHGPNFWQVDTVVAKRIGPSRGPSGELRVEIFNIFNHSNVAGIGATLPNALPTTLLTEANRVQPGQPYTAGAAGAFGRATQTVGTTVGVGTNRQIQLAFRFNF
jgi:Carboxypeptidase regulatory-like domain